MRQSILRRGRASGAAAAVKSTLVFGLALPAAWAPMLSIGGDFYELGAIAGSRAAAALGADGRHWRGDDVIAVFGRNFGADAFSWTDAAGITSSLLLGVALAFATYAAGRGVALALRRAPPRDDR